MQSLICPECANPPYTCVCKAEGREPPDPIWVDIKPSAPRPCPTCSGTKYVQAYNIVFRAYYDVPCPDCYGQGEV